MSYFSKQPLYFTPDAPTTGTQKGIIQPSPDGGWQMSITSDAHPQPVIMKLPDPSNLNAWISGSFGASLEGSDPDEIHMRWGAAKALSSILNKGILPQDTHTSPDNPMNGKDYFTNPDNMQNFYKASYNGKPAYNIYLRALHEAGCSAYGADFDDYMGGDGSVGDAHTNHPYIIIDFGGTSPTPPSFDPSAAVNNLWNHVYTGDEENIPDDYRMFLFSTNELMGEYNQDLAFYNGMTDPAQKKAYYNNTLMPTYLRLSTDIQGLPGDALALLNQFVPEVSKIVGQSLSSDQIFQIAQEIERRFIPQIPPAPPIPSDTTPTYFDIQSFKDYIDQDWLPNQPGESSYNPFTHTGPQGYLRLIIDQLFAQIDAHKFANMGQMMSWINNVAIKDPNLLGKLLDPQIYQKNPDFVKMGPVAAQAELKDLFSKLMITAPVPQPSGPTPAQETNAIYNDPKMKPSFHDQFMALPVFGEIKQYQIDLSAYNKNPTPAGYSALMAEFNKVNQDLSGLTGAVLGLLNKNSAEIQSLKISPSDFANIAAYITGTQEKGNIPSIAPPTPPGPPVPPDLDKLFKLYPDLSRLYHVNEVAELSATLSNEGSSSHSANVIKLMKTHKDRYIQFLQSHGYSPADVAKLSTALSNQEWTDAGGKTPPGPPILPG